MLATKLPTSAEMALYQWSRKGAPAPKLAAPITISATTLSFTSAFKDENDVVVAAGFPLGIRKATGWTEQCWVPARTVDGGGAVLTGLSLDGLTAYGVVRGVDPGSYDYTSGSANFADSHDGDEPVFCNIPAFIPELIRSVLQGLIASGGTSFILGVDASGTVTIKRSTGAGTNAGFLRWDSVTTKAQFSNDGSSWINIDDTVASVLFKVSATDTSPSYAENKIQAGLNITITKKNTGGNEYLEIATVLPQTVVSPSTYAPAYLTGDTSCEPNYLLWGALVDGSFRITIDGTLRNVAAISTIGTTSMADIASRIQVKLRIVTGGLETVTWVTDHFVIASVNTTVSSAITVTSATGSGTDISGAGAFGGLGCDIGHGVVTTAVLNQAADAGKVVLLDTPGKINAQLIPTVTQEMTDFTGIVTGIAGEAINGSVTPQAVCRGGKKEYVLTHGAATLYAPLLSTIGGDTTSIMGASDSYTKEASQFTTPTSTGVIKLTSLVLGFLKVGNPADNVIVEIYTDTGANLPSTLVTNGTSTAVVAPTLHATDFYLLKFVFPTPPTLSSNTKYWITVKRSGGNDAVNYYLVKANTGAAGVGAYYTTSTGVWASLGQKPFNGNLFYSEDFSGAIYKADADDLGRGNFLGFTSNNVSAGQTITVKTSGQVTFPSLTDGAQYFLDVTAGAITTTPTYAIAKAIIPVGRAVSATSLFIDTSNKKQCAVSLVAQSFNSWVSQGVSSPAIVVAVPFLCGFRPKTLRVYANMDSNSGAAGETGIYDYLGTFLVGTFNLSLLIPSKLIQVANTTVNGAGDTIVGTTALNLTVTSINDLGATITVTTATTTAVSYFTGIIILAES